ncbi:MAG: tRNA glutamyl-Q(34) synthetase GluQRS [Gammaproteobacteria bacterium]|nr:tRNA glutamyl-Q(34) synthetase GluQRS [Gammaproteobacteria bacterium]
MPSDNYKGRFAPSPTGPVHYGTLVAAVGSYLQARKNNGEWFVRMDDVDTLRIVDGADSDILHTLDHFGFKWDGEVTYQTQQVDSYQQALEKLVSQSLVFPCTCSRKILAKTDSKIYPGTCRHRALAENEEHALRILSQNFDIKFDDVVMGKRSQNIERQCGDFIIKRRDGLFAYQLAIVVDDAIQGITEVVRGADLLDSTPRQIYLQRLLNYPTPRYCHLPLAIDDLGNKISKSGGAAKVETNDREKLLISSLNFLGQKAPDDLVKSNINDIWSWAIKNWNVKYVPEAMNIKHI